MKYQLFRYKKNGRGETGIRIDGKFYSLNSVARPLDMKEFVDVSIDQLLEDWRSSFDQLSRLAKYVGQQESIRLAGLLKLEDLEFDVPLDRPGVIYAAGANYRDHVEAMGKAFNLKLILDPKSEGVDPWHFIKAGRGTLAAHNQTIAFPSHTSKLDWEAELAVVIGRKASGIEVDQALDYVAGYTCANDLSARDNLTRAKVDSSSPFRFDWIGHKCFTGSCPLGPYLTPAAFVDSPEDLDIRLWVNDVIKQDSNTSNHLYGVAEQISYLSKRLDLYPGDVLLTGTPAGVGIETGTFINSGDVLRVEIEGLGELRTTVV